MCKDIKIQLPKEVETILMKLNNYGYQGYIVGGCVRDSLLNRKPKDWDICTSALPSDVKKIFDDFHIIDTGIKHGTITILIKHIGYEITTFRREGGYSDCRHPDTVEFISDIYEDLSRRDFTINAIAYNHHTGIVDPFGGLNDLQNKIIRCVGDAQIRFKEDPLRILRMLRFQAQLDFGVESKTLKSAFVNRDLLLNNSKERIQTEICKFLYGENGNMASITNILKYPFSFQLSIFLDIIPEMKDMLGFQQNNPYHKYDVFWHTVCALSYVDQDDDLITRLAVLFHDIGKPQCYSEDNKNIGHFYKHGSVGAEITNKVMKRLRFDNDTRKKVVELVFYHDATFNLTKKSICKWLNRIGEEQFRRLLAVRKADVFGQDPESPTLEKRLDKVKRMEKCLDDVLKEKACFNLNQLEISGKDLIRIGMPEGKEIGDMLNKLLEKVISGEVENSREKLMEVVNENFSSQ